MKPPFALSLSEDGLTLLFRVAEGWAPLGHVGFDAPDLETRLADLRTRAAALAPEGVATKLILPDSQILYTEVSAPGPDSASRRAQIATALEGRTPYAVSDLAFDWSRVNGGANVLVAVVARVTLTEAEAFAEAQGFAPVAFVAAPSPGRFAGEPFFGLCARAAAHLPEGARLDRDQDPVRIVALPPAIAAMLAPGAEAADEPESHGEEGADASGAPEVEVEATGGSTTVPAAPAEPPTVTDDADEPSRIEPEPTVPAPAPARGLSETNIPAEGAESANGMPALLADASGPPPVPEAPFIAIEDPAEDLAAGPATETGAVPEDSGHREPPPAFASRRQAADAAEVAPDAPPATPASLLAEATSRFHLLADAPETVTAARGAPRIGPATENLAITAPAIDLPQTVAEARDGDGQNGLRRKGFGRTPLTALPETRHGTQAQLRERQAAVNSLAPAEAAGVFGAATARGASPDRRRLGLILTAALVLVMLAVALWSLWFGDTEATPDPAPAAEISATSPAPAEPVETASAPAPDLAPMPAPPPRPAAAATDGSDGTADPAGAAVTAALAEALAGEDASLASPPEPDAPEVTAPPAEAAPAATPPADAPADASPASPPPAPDAAPEVAATATDAAPATAPEEAPAPVWTGVPEGAAATPEDQNSGAAALAALTDPGGGALPAAPQGLAETAPATAADAVPGAQPLPPPFGTVITFGPDGHIVPTPEGVITPDGFTLYAGRPPLVPAAAPRPSAASVPPAPAEGLAGTEPAPPPLPAPVDPAHAARKPQLRPAAVLERAAAARAAAPAPATPAEPVDPVPAETPPAATEGALPPLPGPVDPAHAAVGPKLRPAAVTARAETARAQAEAISAAAEAAARAEAEALASATRYAVASSRRPTERPSGLAKAVEAAVAAAVTAAVATPEPAPAAAPAPAPEPAAAPAPEAVEIDEPEPLEAVPNMPTTVTVARQATVKNAIDLGKINLIGVYGSSANRRALVRMPSGRLVKVKIGDRLDGGQVAAIGDSELTYVKGGRSFTLKIQKNG